MDIIIYLLYFNLLLVAQIGRAGKISEAITEICGETDTFYDRCNQCTCAGNGRYSCVASESCDDNVEQCVENKKFQNGDKKCVCVIGVDPMCYVPGGSEKKSSLLSPPSSDQVKKAVGRQFFQGNEVRECNETYRFEKDNNVCICREGEFSLCFKKEDFSLQQIILTKTKIHIAVAIICKETLMFYHGCKTCKCEREGEHTCSKNCTENLAEICENDNTFQKDNMSCICLEGFLPMCYSPGLGDLGNNTNSLSPANTDPKERALGRSLKQKLQDTRVAEICVETQSFSEDCNTCTCDLQKSSVQCTKDSCTTMTPICPKTGRLESTFNYKCRVCFCIKDKIPWCFYPDICQAVAEICRETDTFYEGCDQCTCGASEKYSCVAAEYCDQILEPCTENNKYQNGDRTCACVIGYAPLCYIPGSYSESPEQGNYAMGRSIIVGPPPPGLILDENMTYSDFINFSHNARKEITELNIMSKICNETHAFVDGCSICYCQLQTVECTQPDETCQPVSTKCQASGRFEESNCKVCYCLTGMTPWCFKPESCFTAEARLQRVKGRKLYQGYRVNGICDFPIDPGPCYAAISRYAFNGASGECEEFVYGGCQGNPNNFIIEEDCIRSCTGSMY